MLILVYPQALLMVMLLMAIFKSVRMPLKYAFVNINPMPYCFIEKNNTGGWYIHIDIW